MPTSVRLSKPTEDRLNRLARETGRTKAYYIKKSIDEAIDRLEFEFRIKHTSELHRAGKLKTYTMEEVGKKLGL